MSPSSPSRRKARKATRANAPRSSRHSRRASARSRSWRQVATQLEHEIDSGSFEHGRRLPTEATLAEQLETTRHALRTAINHLVGKGLLRREPYVGTFISQQRVELPVSQSVRFIEAIEKAGMVCESRLISHRLGTPPPDAARQLGVPARSQVVEIVKLISVNQTPFGLMTAWLPAERLGRITTLIGTIGSLRRALAQLGVPDTRRKRVRITSRFAERNERQLMEARQKLLVLTIEGVTTDVSGEPTHAYTYVLDARRVSLAIEF